jgi:tetratricopeptide (TPR) repeat protein
MLGASLALTLALGASPPQLAAAKVALQGGRYEEALRIVYDDAKGDAAAPEVAPLAAALLEAAGRYRLARDLRKRLPAKVPPALPPAIRVQGGARAWIGASSLYLRAGPSAGALALGRLPINTQVEVIALDGEWARVRSATPIAPTRGVLLDPFGTGAEGPPAAAAPVATGPNEGYLAAGFLEPAPLEARALEALAARELAAGRADQAAALLDRAVALDPSNAQALRELVGAGLDAGRFAAVANAALVLAGPGAPLVPGLEVDQMDLAYGCRGDRSNAVFVTPSPADLKSGRAPQDACAVNVEPWAPCDACEPDGPSPAEQRRAAREIAAFEARRALLHRIYPARPYLHARLRNGRARAPLPASRLHVYAAKISGGCDELAGREPGWSVKLAEVNVPALQPLESVDLWIPVPEYAGRYYGLLAARAADDLHQAVKRLEQGATDLVRGPDLAIDGMPPRRGVETSGDPCCCD